MENPIKIDLGGGFNHFFFSSLFGEMIQFDEHIFQMGWNHQLGMAAANIQLLIVLILIGLLCFGKMLN